MSVLVQLDKNGETTFFVTAGTQLFIVDERCKNDRVYQMTANATKDQIAELIGDSTVGNSQDKRHAAVKARVLAMHDGELHLKTVGPSDLT